MNHNRIKGSIVIITCFVALGIFFLIFSIWNEAKYNQPLSEYLDNKENISNYQLEETNNNEYLIEIELKYHPYINNTVLEIEEKIEDILGSNNWQLIFSYDEDNDNLKQAFYNIHFVLYEAKEIGNYREMHAEIDGILKNHMVDHYQIHILSDDRIVVQMKDNIGFFIYILSDDFAKNNHGRV